MATTLVTGTLQLLTVAADVRREQKTNTSRISAERNLQRDLGQLKKRSIWLQLSVKDGACANGNEQLGLYRSENDPWNIAAVGSLLGHYGAANALADGRRVHASIIRNGFDHNIFLQNCLMLMYGTCGSMEDAIAAFEKIANPNTYSWNILINAYVQNGNFRHAQLTFHKMPDRDVVSWNTIISGCTHTGHDIEALHYFHKMHTEGVKPNRTTFMCALDACSSLADALEGQKVHDVIREHKHEQDVVVGTALVSMYGKSGSLQNARSVFCKIRRPNVVSWSAMIAACVQNGLPEEALQLYQEMQLKTVKPNKVTFISALDACARIAALEEGRAIHAALVDIGSDQEIVPSTALINMYGKCNRVHEAASVFAKSCKHDLTSWSALIGVCAQNGLAKDALNVLSQMQHEGFEPNNVTFVCFLYACNSPSTLESLQNVHSFIVANGCEADVLVGTMLVTMYGRCERLQDAKRIFGKMSQTEVITWNALITAFNQNGCGKEVLSLFTSMCLKGVKPSKITFICVLDACSTMGALKVGLEIHAFIVEAGYEKDTTVGSALINLYGKCGSLDIAMSIFRNLTQRSAVTWSAVIGACSQNGHDDEALDLFCQMELEGVKPNIVTYICALTACSRAGRVDEARDVFVSMNRDSGIIHDAKHYGCMIDLLGRAGQLDEAEDLINNAPLKNMFLAWLNLLSACRIHRDVERGERAASHCLKLDPGSDSPYLLLLNVYAAAERWDSVEKVKQAWKENLAENRLIDVDEMLGQFVTIDFLCFHGEDVRTEIETMSQEELFEIMNS